MTALTSSLVYLPSDPDEGSNVGAFLRASDGTLIDHTASALNVHVASGSVAIDSDHLEDAAHVSGHTGSFALAIRVADVQAVPAGALAGDALDYQGLISGPGGELLTTALLRDGAGNAIGSNSGALNVSVASVDPELANSAIENTATAVSTTAVPIVSSAIADRKYVFLANLGNKVLYFGKPGVTTANGYPLFAREKLAARIGSAIAAAIIGGAGASSEDLRVMELA